MAEYSAIQINIRTCIFTAVTELLQPTDTSHLLSESRKLKENYIADAVNICLNSSDKKTDFWRNKICFRG